MLLDRQLNRLLRTAVLFIGGFISLACLADHLAGLYIARTGRVHLIGGDIYAVRMQLAETNPAVRTVFLGDSVARQLFPPGNEPQPGVKFLTSNQAISVAGQYYLLEDAVRCYPNLHEVFLFYSVICWRNNLDLGSLTRDYFCGNFHTWRQVSEAFAAHRNLPLALAHGARTLLPNLLTLSSAVNVAPPTSHSEETHSDEAHSPRVVKPSKFPLSRVSVEFLKRINALCARRGIVLRVYPTPISDEFRYLDEEAVYDAPLVYCGATNFVADRVHLKPTSLPAVRELMSSTLGLLDLDEHSGSAHSASLPQTTGLPRTDERWRRP